MTLLEQLKSHALQHGWQIWWQHDFPNSSHLGLRHPDTTDRMSLTFHGEWQLIGPTNHPRNWRHRPEANGTLEHCGYWWSAEPDDLICTDNPTQARKLIRDRSRTP